MIKNQLAIALINKELSNLQFEKAQELIVMDLIKANPEHESEDIILQENIIEEYNSFIRNLEDSLIRLENN